MAYKFSQDIASFAAKAGENLDTVATEVCATLVRKVVKRSPVGDPALWQSKPPAGYIGGQFRGNWFSSLDSPITTPEFGNIDPSGQDAIARGVSVAANAGGHVFYLTNNLPYARRLEYGWSTQAAQGMVRISMTEIDQSIRDAISKLK